MAARKAKTQKKAPWVRETATPANAVTAEETPPNAESLPYHVSRVMPSKNLPIYTDRKGHGSLKITLVRKVVGDKYMLAKDLKEHLRIAEDKDCKVNPVTGHVVLKGHWVREIREYLTRRGF